MPVGVLSIDTNEILISSYSGNGNISIIDTNDILIREWPGFLLDPVLTPNRNIAVISGGATEDPRIVIYSQQGDLIARFGKKGTGISDFVYARDLAVDRNGNLYVADSNGGKIMVFRLPAGI